MKKFIIILTLGVTISTVPLFGQTGWVVTDKMDVGKSWLADHGIELETVYKGEIWANLRGGISTGHTHMHDIDVTALFDTGKLGMWDNGEFFIYVLSTQGGSLLSEEIVGDTQIVSHIEAPHSTRIYEMWYEHHFFHDKLSLLFGIHDLNSELAVTEYGSLFINSSFGIPIDFSDGARPGIFPLAAPALLAEYSPNESWDFMLGIYNGDPGDPSIQKHLPKFTFSSNDGVLIDFETAYHFAADTLPGTVKFGYWRNTGEFEDVLETNSEGTPIIHSGNQGIYFVADKVVYDQGDGQGLAGFLQLGWAPDEDINEFGSYLGGGIKYTGLVPHRNMDEFGFAVAHARLSNKLASEPGYDNSETILEITYKAIFNKYLALQPDVQFILNPSADSNLGNAVVLGARLEVIL
ncbi:MAG: carbohydrate porin [Acidobacteriota bacterium]